MGFLRTGTKQWGSGNLLRLDLTLSTDNGGGSSLGYPSTSGTLHRVAVP
ncbi:MAG: hypothetical protein Q8L48_27600 [Archangium sp.]|nr:hypothetical protein [Archangium sp.]